MMKHECATPEQVYLNRRRFLASLAVMSACLTKAYAQEPVAFASEEPPSDWGKVTRYNNYYEFSTNKESVSILAKALTIEPWVVEVGGEVEQSIELDLKALLAEQLIQTYQYRLRCVEGWSAVIPWQGFQLKQLINKARPKETAKYVKFESIYRPEEMVNQRRQGLEWPYTEALRLDEALNPLTILAVGMYNKPMAKQNGAPIRLVVPWKYGFKSIKAISKITLVKERPVTSWMKAIPSEYGFYANVNPSVAHPRWSQRRELRLGETRKRKTLMFNGYAEHVAHLYKGMDLEENF